MAKYENIIQNAAKENSLDPDLLKAVIQQESGFNASATSSAGAQGLMQIMPLHGLNNPFDPKENVDFGARYLKKQIDKFGSVELGLAAYNAGPGNVSKYDGIPPFQETQDYVKKITANYSGDGSGAGGGSSSGDTDSSRDDLLGKVFFGSMRALIVVGVLIVGVIFVMKAFPVTRAGLDLVDPSKKMKAVRNLAK